MLQDLMNFVLSMGGLSVLVFGLVEFVKKFGVQGEKLTAISAAIGGALSVFFYLAVRYDAVREWYVMVAFGILGALAASGLYDFTKQFKPQ